MIHSRNIFIGSIFRYVEVSIRRVINQIFNKQADATYALFYFCTISNEKYFRETVARIASPRRLEDTKNIFLTKFFVPS